MTKPKPLHLLLQGGLGNQLLQLVLAQTLAEQSERPLVIDTTLMNSWSRSHRGLTQRRISTLIGPTSAAWHHWLGARVRRRIYPKTPHVLTDRKLLEIHNDAARLSRLTPELLITHGTSPVLFESPFRSAWEAVQQRLPAATTSAPVGVHLRRGDYLNPQSGFMALPLDYFQRAIALIFEQRPHLERRVQLFSDDPEWGQAHLTSPDWHLEISTGTPEEDLASMAAMQALVISNSSLSAVAAHLGECFGRLDLVICPDQWLSDPSRKALGDLRKPGWITLPIQP